MIDASEERAPRATPWLVFAFFAAAYLLSGGRPEEPLAADLLARAGAALLGALTCAAFFRLCIVVGCGAAGASIATLVLGLASPVWVYARVPAVEIAQMACFTGLFGAALVAWERSRAAAIALSVVAAAVGCVSVVLAQPVPDAFRERTLVGLWGMFFSPGKSLFLYAPPLVLSLLGLPRLWRGRSPILLLTAVAFGVPALVLAKLLWWAGPHGFGPRSVVFAVPVLLVPGALVIDGWLAARRWSRLPLGAALAAGGLLVQLIGNALPFREHAVVAQEASRRWLGEPNRGGAVPWRGGASCGPCFEDQSPSAWMPPFQPIRLQGWQVRHLLRGDPWDVAEADAPWRPHTRLRLDVRASYERARIDWWWSALAPRTPAGASAAAAVLAGALLAAAVAWWRTLRRDPA